MSDTHTRGKATARDKFISAVHSATGVSPISTRRSPAYSSRKPRELHGAVIVLSSEDDDASDTVTPGNQSFQSFTCTDY